jgi:two-component system CheB/CheR fusion protein
MKPQTPTKKRAVRRTESQVRKQNTSPPTRVNHSKFSVVGIGSSAGGFEALERFLRHVPRRSGLAFVLVQHLDPTHKGIMPELLQRVTRMQVFEVKDGMKVEPDCVYVIPPNKDMSILGGVLHLLEPAAPRGLRLPIDFFLRSLAQDFRERSIGVILSGMGSDGTLGLRAIKENAGFVLVQEPSSAKFDGMPRSAIDAGLADIVAPVEDLPRGILAVLKRMPRLAVSEKKPVGQAGNAFDKTIILIRERTGHDFSVYKPSTLLRRIERRMGIHQIERLDGYVRFLRENPQEVDLLFNELLIGVTTFFRDTPVWEQLKKSVLPELLAERLPGNVLRAWVPGCSTGEEAYSLAMIFKEAVAELKPKRNFTLQIFATDLDRDAIDRARRGFYPANIAADVSSARLKRFFVKENEGFRVRNEIREMVIFAPQNLTMDPPFTKLDLLSCRNLLIYLSADLQKKLIPLFHYSLHPGGILLLGSAETTGSNPKLFTSLGGRTRIFRRSGALPQHDQVDFPSAFTAVSREISEPTNASSSSINLQTAADQLVLRQFAPPAVLTNDQGDILYISGHTGKYLEAAAGRANWNIFVMARESLRYELSTGFQKSLRTQEAVILSGLHVVSNGHKQSLKISIRQLDDPESLRGMVMIVFTDVAEPTIIRPDKCGQKRSPRHERVTELEEEIIRIRNEARTTREDMQAAQEEGRATNEELQSTNEELQSTNEELTTSKEEMQSLNEELQTVNAELQAKLDELSRADSDMKNLLDSTDIATLFLDRKLNVRRYTPRAARIIKLIPADEGRPVTDLASQLDYPDLACDARDVLRKLIPVEKPVSAKDGRWFTVRIMPYLSLEDRIDGVVITFTDITKSKNLEAKLRSGKSPSPKNRMARSRTQPGKERPCG